MKICDHACGNKLADVAGYQFNRANKHGRRHNSVCLVSIAPRRLCFGYFLLAENSEHNDLAISDDLLFTRTTIESKSLTFYCFAFIPILSVVVKLSHHSMIPIV